MTPTLTREGDKVLLSLKGHPNFHEALARAKMVPGRNWNSEAKVWEYPAKEQVVMRIMHTIHPNPDATIMSMLRDSHTKIADELSARLPTDAELYSPLGPRLFQFQRPAVDFMANMRRVLLADDMGLGKTIESIVAIDEWRHRLAAALRDPRPAWREAAQTQSHQLDRPKLVVAATSKLGDWAEEIEAWHQGPVEVVAGDFPAKKRRRLLENFYNTAASWGGWLVVNHEQLRANEDGVPKEPWFAEQEWLALIGDEAHRFKNRNAQQTRGIRLIQSHLCYLLTGSPIMNDPGDLWTLLAIVRPDLYQENSRTKTTYWQFVNTYVDDYLVEFAGGKKGRVVAGVKNEEELRFELADKMIRRSKRILVEAGLLPKKLPIKVREIPMRPDQAKLYAEAEKELFLSIEQDLEELRDLAHDDLSNIEATGEQVARNEQIVAARRQLEQVEAKLDRGQSDSAVLRFLPNAASKYAVLRQIATSPGLLGAKDSSGKLDAIIEEIEDHEGKPFVVFGWHRQTAELLVERLAKRKISAEYMHGGTGQLERTEVVRRFEEAETQVLVMTIKTGGEGLNLVRADTVLFAEQSDSLAHNDQGADRLWRLGQRQEVTEVVYRSAGTVETENQALRLRMKEIVQGATIGRDRET